MHRPAKLLALSLGLIFGLSSASANEPLEVDRIVAVVGNEVITRHELKARLNTISAQLSRQNTPLPPKDVLEKQVLERMIMDRAQVQLGQELGLQVDDQQLDEAIARIAANNNVSLPQFRKTIEKDGISFAMFREEIRNEIALSRVRQREVENRLVISESEIDNFLAQQKETPSTDQFHLAHILIRIPENASPDQINKLQAKAEQAHKRLLAKENFAKVAAAFSEAPDAMQGGDLGWRPADRVPNFFIATISSIKPGQISNVVRSPAGFHIIKLIDKKDGGLATNIRQTRARHILIKVNELVSESEAKHKLTLLRERLTHGANFAELARLHSQDGSAPKGGDLGWLYPGDTVPEFERAMDDLKPGVVSQPVQSPFGFHLIEVLERRVQDASDERKRQTARQALKDRKLEEAYEEWLRQLRDRTYVEYRLEEQ